MPTRRSFLAASATGALAAAAGCTDSLPVVGSSSGGKPSSGQETVESFVADPSFASSFDAVREPHATDCSVRYFDNSLTEHVDDLSIERDISRYGIHVLRLGEEDSEAIESIDDAIEVGYVTSWKHDDPEDSFPRYGKVRGGLGSLRGQYDRDAYEAARDFEGSPSFSSRGYDVYGVGESTISTGLADDGILQGVAFTPHVPGEEVERATVDEVEAALIEQGTRRSTSTQSPQGWIQDVVDAVSPGHFLSVESETASEGGYQSAHARGFHVDGTETTVTIAEAAPSASDFDTEDWNDGTKERSLLHSVGDLARETVVGSDTWQEREDAIREMLVEGPTIDVGDSFGVVTAVVPSDAVTEPYF